MSQPIHIDKAPGVYYFWFQFFAHKISFSKDLYNVKNPAIAVRFIDFPTLLIKAKINSDGTIGLESGKKTIFSMHSDDLYGALKARPAMVMLVDADPTNVNILCKFYIQIIILASTSISLKIFAENKNFLNYEDPSSNLKKSPITLFDSLRNPIAKLDSTICISLLDRNSVDAIKERERMKGTAIKDSRVTHKSEIPDYSQEYPKEESKYDLKGKFLVFNK